MLGYYTLASGAIDVGSLPAKQAKKLPRLPCPSSCSHVWPLIEAFKEKVWVAPYSETLWPDRSTSRRNSESTRLWLTLSMPRPRRSMSDSGSRR